MAKTADDFLADLSEYARTGRVPARKLAA